MPAISCRSRPNSDARITSEPSAYACISPYSIPLWTIFTKCPAPEHGWADVGGPGAGHFVKMVHNGIEYGLMQAYAEGFELMNHAEFDLDLAQIAGIWRYGSVVRSWLLELLHEAFESHGSELDDIAGYVEDSGEGRWTINEAINAAVPVPVMSAALFARFASRR